MLEATKDFRNAEESFWQEALDRCNQLGVNRPKEERIRKVPKRFHNSGNLDESSFRIYAKEVYLGLSTKFNSQSASNLKGPGYLAPQRLSEPDALKSIQNAVDW